MGPGLLTDQDPPAGGTGGVSRGQLHFALADLAAEQRADQLVGERLALDRLRLELVRVESPTQQQPPLGAGGGNVGEPGLLLGFSLGRQLGQRLEVVEPFPRPSEPAELHADTR